MVAANKACKRRLSEIIVLEWRLTYSYRRDQQKDRLCDVQTQSPLWRLVSRNRATDVSDDLDWKALSATFSISRMACHLTKTSRYQQDRNPASSPNHLPAVADRRAQKEGNEDGGSCYRWGVVVELEATSILTAFEGHIFSGRKHGKMSASKWMVMNRLGYRPGCF